MRPTVSLAIPQPCPESWEAMTPTAQGRHCVACASEVVDFTRMTEAEVLAFMAARKGQRVCALLAAHAVAPTHHKRAKGPRRWLLAAAAFFGGQQVPAESWAPQALPAPMVSLQTPAAAFMTVRGVVVDDSLDVPVREAYVFIDGTKYGAITNERGEFTLTFPADWGPVKNGIVPLRIACIPFTFLEQTVSVNIGASSAPGPVVVRLLSVPGRGFVVGEAVIVESPKPLPKFDKLPRKTGK